RPCTDSRLIAAAEQPDAADERRRVSRQPTSRLRTPVQRFALALRARIFKGQRPAALAADLGVIWTPVTDSRFAAILVVACLLCASSSVEAISRDAPPDCWP